MKQRFGVKPGIARVMVLGIILVGISQLTIFSSKKNDAENTGSPKIIWDQSTLKQVSPSNAKGANYARMIQLNSSELICVYESRGSIECTASNDLGATWQLPVIIAAAIPNIRMSVPDIIELKDNSLLVSYNPRPRKINGQWDTTRRFSPSAQRKVMTMVKPGRMNACSTRLATSLKTVVGNLLKFS